MWPFKKQQPPVDSVRAAELAQALLTEYIDNSKVDNVTDFTDSSVDHAAGERYHGKVRLYRLAVVLKILASEERTNNGLALVRDCLERWTFPPSQSESVIFMTALRAAMEDIAELISPESPKMSWAQNWLSDIGIDGTNPVCLHLLATHWVDQVITLSKIIREFRPG